MSERPNRRSACFNGDFAPESHVPAPVRARGWRWGAMLDVDGHLNEGIGEGIGQNLWPARDSALHTPRRETVPGCDCARQDARFLDRTP